MRKEKRVYFRFDEIASYFSDLIILCILIVQIDPTDIVANKLTKYPHVIIRKT